MHNMLDIVCVRKRGIHDDAVERSWIAVALQEIGLPCVIDTVNRSKPVSHIAIQLDCCDRVAVSIAANRINDSAWFLRRVLKPVALGECPQARPCGLPTRAG
jgi:hypothetical protein